MRTHPVFLCLEGRPCVVIGGDPAAADKVRACVRAGAVVTVVAPHLDAEIAPLARAGRIRHMAREYETGDLDGAVIAYASTRDPSGIARLQHDARRARVLLNVIDVPDACAFLSPAVVARGDLLVAISTGGASPALAGRLRRELEALIGPEYDALVSILGAVRRRLDGSSTRAAVLGALLDAPLLDLVRRGDARAVDALLDGIVGDGCSLAGLGVGLVGTGG